MISTRAGKDPVTSPNAPLATASHVPQPLASRLRHHPARHLRGLVRLARQRRTVAFALCAVSASGLATAAATFATVQHLHAAQVQPLAPARPPLSAADAMAATTTHRAHPLLSRLAVNPLRNMHPLQGIASWYGAVLHGHKTASGEAFDEADLTACHRTLPFGTRVLVTDTSSQRSVIVRINDRGVLNPDRVIDLSAAAADKLGILRSGLAHVKLEVLQTTHPPSTPAPAQND